MQTAATLSTKKLLVGNLPDSTQTEAVSDLFSTSGPVLSVAVVRNGFAFVEMAAADADKARQQFNGHRFNGRLMMVDEAHPRTSPRR